MRYVSPLRYPGGKSALVRTLGQVIEINDLRGCDYFEPFAGGAGAALKLLTEGLVDSVHLNDADPCIYAFWLSVLREPERFAERIMSVPLTIAEWRRQHRVCMEGDQAPSFDLGFATFYMNRCNRSGVLKGAGPIGGYGQNGGWRLDARFRREMLAKRVLNLIPFRGKIRIHNMDALEFLPRVLPSGSRRREVFVYLDPPYYENGRRLYMNFYERSDHRRLARYVLRQATLKWLMSYEDVSFIRALYARCTLNSLSFHYSLQERTERDELLIAPQHLHVPFCSEPSRKSGERPGRGSRESRSKV